MWEKSQVEFSGIYPRLIVVNVERQANVVLVNYLVLQLNKFKLTYFVERDGTRAEASWLAC